MLDAKHYSTCALLLVCLLFVPGCTQNKRYDSKAKSETSSDAYYRDESGRTYYREASGRSFYIDEHGVRRYGNPRVVERAPVSGGEVAMIYHIDASGKKYLIDEMGNRYYVESPIRRITIDELGNKFYLDENGVKHFIKNGVVRTYSTDASGRVYYVDEIGTKYYIPDVARHYYIDERGRKFYVIDKDRRFIIDESGSGYYIADTIPGVVAAPAQPMPRVVQEPVRVIRVPEPVNPREAIVLACGSRWNACANDCNTLGSETAKERCLKRCDRDQAECLRKN